MATEVTMPQMGADMTEGTLVKWVKQVGDQVNRGEVLAEIETDKATVELEAFESGVLKKLVVEEGETVPVGQVIAILGAADEQVEGETPRQPAAVRPSLFMLSRWVIACSLVANGCNDVVEASDTDESGDSSTSSGLARSRPCSRAR